MENEINQEDRRKAKELLREYEEKVNLLRSHLDKDKTFFSSCSEAYKKTMKSCFKPFASYHRSLESQLNDPLQFKFDKLIHKAFIFNNKMAKLEFENLTPNKIDRLLAKVEKIHSKLHECKVEDSQVIMNNVDSTEIMKLLECYKNKLDTLKLNSTLQVIDLSGADNLDTKNLSEILKELKNHGPEQG